MKLKTIFVDLGSGLLCGGQMWKNRPAFGRGWIRYPVQPCYYILLLSVCLHTSL